MDESTTHVANPFALMLNPADVIAAVESSERLGRLQRRICKPLDKPLIPKAPDAAASFDDEIDQVEEPSHD